MAIWEFPYSDPIDVFVGIAAGSATMTAELTDVVTVRAHQGRFSDTAKETADADRLADDLTVEFANGRLDISEPEKRGHRRHNKSLHLAISVPAETSCTVVTASADVRCLGEYSAVDIRTASGRVDVHYVRGPAEISTMSGGVQIDQAAEPNVQSASGRILVRHATGDLTARTASGNISIGRADASVTARTASGEVLINSVARGRADLNSVSGDVRVRVAQGTGVFLDLASVTGRVTSDLDPSDQQGKEDLQDLRLHSRTVSGAIHVARSVTADVAS
jgi:DUF4097 and DUF4098 domain-containing protein YvlB